MSSFGFSRFSTSLLCIMCIFLHRPSISTSLDLSGLALMNSMNSISVFAKFSISFAPFPLLFIKNDFIHFPHFPQILPKMSTFTPFSSFSFSSSPSSSSFTFLLSFAFILGISFASPLLSSVDPDKSFTDCCTQAKLKPITVKEACHYPPGNLTNDEEMDIAFHFPYYIGCYAGHKDNRDCCIQNGVVGEYEDCQDLCNGANPPYDPSIKYLKCTRHESPKISAAIAKCNKLGWGQGQGGIEQLRSDQQQFLMAYMDSVNNNNNKPSAFANSQQKEEQSNEGVGVEVEEEEDK